MTCPLSPPCVEARTDESKKGLLNVHYCIDKNALRSMPYHIWYMHSHAKYSSHAIHERCRFGDPLLWFRDAVISRWWKGNTKCQMRQLQECSHNFQQMMANVIYMSLQVSSRLPSLAPPQTGMVKAPCQTVTYCHGNMYIRGRLTVDAPHVYQR